MKKLILTALTVLTFNAKAGNDVGGGGVLCLAQDKCITLAEAGLRIKQEAITAAGPQKPVVSQEVMDEINVIKSLMPKFPGKLQNSFWDFMNVSPHSFVRVESFDPVKFKKVKAEYAKILAENSFPIDSVEIAAVSEPKMTYLLPEYDKLNTRSKALFIIHECVVRASGSFAVALEMDGYIQDALNGDKRTYNLVKTIFKMRVTVGDRWAENNIVLASFVRSKMQTGQKFKLNNSLIKKSINGASFKDDLYTSNDIYNAYPELWNEINSLGINTIFTYINIDSGYDGCANDEARCVGHGLIEASDLGFCTSTPDGVYLTGNVNDNNMTVIQCKKNLIQSLGSIDFND